MTAEAGQNSAAPPHGLIKLVRVANSGSWGVWEQRWGRKGCCFPQFSKYTSRQRLSRKTIIIVISECGQQPKYHSQREQTHFQKQALGRMQVEVQSRLTWSKSPFSIASSSISGVDSSSRKGLVDASGDSSFFCWDIRDRYLQSSAHCFFQVCPRAKSWNLT